MPSKCPGGWYKPLGFVIGCLTGRPLTCLSWVDEAVSVPSLASETHHFREAFLLQQQPGTLSASLRVSLESWEETMQTKKSAYLPHPPTLNWSLAEDDVKIRYRCRPPVKGALWDLCPLCFPVPLPRESRAFHFISPSSLPVYRDRTGISWTARVSYFH